MSVRDLTETEFHQHRITTFVPLFDDGEKDIGIHINMYERFGAWSFEMESDLHECQSLIGELFDGLCRKAGLRRRITCALDLEIGKRDLDYEFLCTPCGALASGDFFTLEAIHHLLATAFIPYWQLAARQINEFNIGHGWDDAYKRAESALGKWDEFDKAESDDIRWGSLWNDVNCGYDRRQLIRGDNWRAPIEERPLERFEEHAQ